MSCIEWAQYPHYIAKPASNLLLPSALGARALHQRLNAQELEAEYDFEAFNKKPPVEATRMALTWTSRLSKRASQSCYCPASVGSLDTGEPTLSLEVGPLGPFLRVLPSVEHLATWPAFLGGAARTA